MKDRKEERLANLLGQAQVLMVELSRQYAVAGQFDRAQRPLEWARQVDGIRNDLNTGGERQASGAHPEARRLPYYYTKHEKLVKLGSRRDGGTYYHRVTREHYDLITSRLRDMARMAAEFETQRLVDGCDVPKHEPLLVVNMLSQQGLLDSARRGRWRFIDREKFSATVEEVWRRLPRE